MSSSSPESSVLAGNDILRGLSTRPRTLPSKYFYDDRGSALFDRICDLPEYYPTRTERRLLTDVSETIAEITEARELVELGAGTARKTVHLIRAFLARRGTFHYAPLDISEYALAMAAESLSMEFPGLYITGVQCDYTETLEPLDPDPGCLVAFLGSTVGNFPHAKGVALLRRVRDRLAPGDWLLMGVDLVKPVEVLEAAYNDSQGVTAAFNKNILNVVNREMAGDFDPDDFRHRAFFNEKESRIEMHLVADRDVRVRLEGPGFELEIEEGETIRTEVSRKFTRDSTSALLAEADFSVEHWFESEDGYFGLALASVNEE